jgi:hypothetical protein
MAGAAGRQREGVLAELTATNPPFAAPSLERDRASGRFIGGSDGERTGWTRSVPWTQLSRLGGAWCNQSRLEAKWL